MQMHEQKLRRVTRAAARGERGMTLLEILIVLAILAVVIGFLFGPQIMQMFGESKVKTTRLMVQKLAYEAYPRWQMDNQKSCPGDLSELAKYTNNEETKDAWGNPLKMLCGDDAPSEAHGFGIVSLGADGKEGGEGESADIKSWDKGSKGEK